MKQCSANALTDAEIIVGEQVSSKYWTENDLVFPNSRGKLESYAHYSKALHQIIVDAGVVLPPRSLTHRLRHTASSILFSQNSSSAKVAEFLGNTTDTAEKYYKSFQEDSMNDLASAIESFVTNLK